MSLANTQESCGIAWLPSELLSIIFCFSRHLRQVRSVCRAWRDVVDGSSALRAIGYADRIYDPTHIPTIIESEYVTSVLDMNANMIWIQIGRTCVRGYDLKTLANITTVDMPVELADTGYHVKLTGACADATLLFNAGPNNYIVVGSTCVSVGELNPNEFVLTMASPTTLLTVRYTMIQLIDIKTKEILRTFDINPDLVKMALMHFRGDAAYFRHDDAAEQCMKLDYTTMEITNHAGFITREQPSSVGLNYIFEGTHLLIQNQAGVETHGPQLNEVSYKAIYAAGSRIICEGVHALYII
jgi:hypothetical protein